ncbi:hypothetical protein HID58_016340 [Brassica napus]|uniref:Uncharacterized protein n=3 Tax=Brassica TaxID=3705 RepID=A0ABQ8DMS9_BRANA|nr:hypothetical protein HID58_016340 [Brassica napus]
MGPVTKHPRLVEETKIQTGKERKLGEENIMRRRRKWRIAVGLSRILTWKLRNLVIGYTEIEKIDELVFTELRAQKAEDLEILIWKVKTRTLEHLMLGLVVGTLQNPNQLESLEKLKRIEKCS